MPITVCKLSNNLEHLVAMRNQHLDLWDIDHGKRGPTIKMELDDWSSHHEGTVIERRHLVSSGEHYMYASFKGHAYHIRSIVDQKYSKTVEVFRKYKYNKASVTADFPPNDHDHISTLVLTPDGTVVVLCNGANQDIHLYNFEKGVPIKVIKGQGSNKMRHFFFPPGCDWFYYANKDLVGTINLRENSTKTMLPHPCKVRKVVGIDTKFVITIGEDSILRIWDKTMEPFKQDLSMTTGKVKVTSKDMANQSEAAFIKMFNEIVGDDFDTQQIVDTRDMLTTEEIENYWTKATDSSEEEQPFSSIITKFHMFKDQRYVGVSQHAIHANITCCFCVWDVAHMQCIRRMYLPQMADNSVVVWDLIDDKTLLISENRRLKLMDLHDWKVTKVFQGRIAARLKPYVIYLSKRTG